VPWRASCYDPNARRLEARDRLGPALAGVESIGADSSAEGARAELRARATRVVSISGRIDRLALDAAEIC
jgi:hypothetical protein